MTRLIPLALAACTSPTVDVPISPVPSNPYLAETAWPMSHASPYAQGSAEQSGLPEAEAYDIDFAPTGIPSITLATAPPYPDGTEVVWGSTSFNVFKLKLGDDLEILSSVNDGNPLADIVAGAYTVLDADGVFYSTTATTVRAFRDAVPDDPVSDIVLAGRIDLATEGGGTLRGLGLTWDGILVAVSSTGRVVALSRELEVVDEVWLDGEVSNSHAIDENGGIYIVTSEAMHRVQWTGNGLSTDPADGAWQAAYQTGSDDVAGGRLGAGSGSTPSLMDAGDDRLVVITDARPLMHLVLFWRDGIPAGWQAPEGADPRVAGELPVRFGEPDRTSSISEQSVLVMGQGAVVVNNDYGDSTGLEPILQGIASPGVEKFVWDPTADTLSSVWSIPDLACPNGIPSASVADRRMYCVGKRGPDWTIEVIDWDDGTPLFHVPMGPEDRYNSAYAATEIGANGEILTGTLEGTVRVRAAD